MRSLPRDAVAATRWYWPDVPKLGMITFVDASKLRAKDESEVGRCYLEAGFYYCGFSKDGKYAFQLRPQDMPSPEPPIGVTMNLQVTAWGE